jgi:uracil-DNA glycosylase
MTLASYVPAAWSVELAAEFGKKYFKTLENIIVEAYDEGPVYPPQNQIFRALSFAPPENIRVVIVGQDPYHGVGEANGLAFAVNNEHSPKPPSLLNIFKEMETDLQCKVDKDQSSLEGWAKQGVLLLNTSLTVVGGQPASHANIGWSFFTDAILTLIVEKSPAVAFLLWGKFAKSKRQLVKNNKHLVLEAAHPSPLSAYTGFFGCRHFSRANCYMMDHNIEPIDWVSTSCV